MTGERAPAFGPGLFPRGDHPGGAAVFRVKPADFKPLEVIAEAESPPPIVVFRHTLPNPLYAPARQKKLDVEAWLIAEGFRDQVDIVRDSRRVVGGDNEAAPLFEQLSEPALLQGRALLITPDDVNIWVAFCQIHSHLPEHR